MRPRKWSGLVIIASFAVAVTVAALAQEATIPVDASVAEETAPAPESTAPLEPDAGTEIPIPALATVEPTAAPDTDLLMLDGKPTSLVTDGETTTIADAVEDVETVKEAAGILKWLHLLIVLLVPAAILALKKVADKLPSHYLPLIAPVLGAAADAVAAMATGGNANPLIGGLAGMAAVGLREIGDQWKKWMAQKANTP